MTTLAIRAPQSNVETITCAGLTRISSCWTRSCSRRWLLANFSGGSHRRYRGQAPQLTQGARHGGNECAMSGKVRHGGAAVEVEDDRPGTRTPGLPARRIDINEVLQRSRCKVRCAQ